MIWTLWLITFGAMNGQGGASVALTPLAMYQAEAECRTSIGHISIGLETTYGKANRPSPGIPFCVGGTPVTR